jgi:alpha-tubulin suppressor-like RCC1 family protein
VTTSGVLAGKTVSKVAVNGDQTCVVADGKAYCFGDTYEGALGNGVTARTNQTTPIAVDASGVLAGKTVTDITVGGYYAYYGCVIADGKAYCWGINTSEGRLGDGSTANRPTPVAVSTSGVLAGKTVTDISAYEYHVCVVADGGAYCWGGNGNGSLGNGTTNISTTPVAVTSTGALAGKTVTAVAAGDYHTCGIASGKAYCWGDSSQGTLGNGMSGPIANQLTPVPVSVSGVLSGKTVTAIASGYNHTCVIADRLPHCWGDTVNWWGGVLGNGNTTGSNIPVLVSPIP